MLTTSLVRPLVLARPVDHGARDPPDRRLVATAGAVPSSGPRHLATSSSSRLAFKVAVRDTLDADDLATGPCRLGPARIGVQDRPVGALLTARAYESVIGDPRPARGGRGPRHPHRGVDARRHCHGAAPDRGRPSPRVVDRRPGRLGDPAADRTHRRGPPGCGDLRRRVCRRRPRRVRCGPSRPRSARRGPTGPHGIPRPAPPRPVAGEALALALLVPPDCRRGSSGSSPISRSARSCPPACWPSLRAWSPRCSGSRLRPVFAGSSGAASDPPARRARAAQLGVAWSVPAALVPRAGCPLLVGLVSGVGWHDRARQRGDDLHNTNTD